MKFIGLVAVVLGIILSAYAAMMDTTVTYISGMSRFGKEGFDPKVRSVHNIGLMQDRQNLLILGGLTILAGVLLVGFSRLSPRKHDDDRKINLSKSDSTDDLSDDGEFKLKFYNGERDLTDAGYQLFLTRRYRIEKNNTLQKYVVGDDVFDSLEQVLAEADRRYSGQIADRAEKARIEDASRLAKVETNRKLVEEHARLVETQRVHQAEATSRLDPIRVAKRKRLYVAIGLSLAAAAFGVISIGASRIKERAALEAAENKKLAEKVEAERLAALVREETRKSEDNELKEMFSTGLFFGFKIGENNLEALTKATGQRLQTEYVWGSHLLCEDGCGKLLGKSSLSARVRAVSFSYCIPDKLEKMGDKHYKLQEVRIQFWDASEKYKLLDVVKAVVQQPDANSNVTQKLTANDRGIGVKRVMNGKDVVDLCGNRRDYNGSRL